MIELKTYCDEAGHAPFREWHASLRDKLASARILARLRQLQQGNFGDCEPVGEGVMELKIHVGAGYRVYCARHGSTVVLLLCGGDKQSQAQDIRTAQRFWAIWKKEQR